MSDLLSDAIKRMEEIESPAPAESTFLNFLRHLREASLRVEVDEENRMVNFGIGGNGASFRVVAYVDEDGRYFTVMTVSSVTCMKQQRQLMAELICRINYRLAVGGFEFDMRDGELRYKITQLIGSSPIEMDVLKQCLGLCVFTHERYAKILIPICLGLAPRSEEILEELKEMLEPDG